ncbi:MAG: flippase [Bacteroidota bacterium]|nr:flippase [Bacteroidota bacterium]
MSKSVTTNYIFNLINTLTQVLLPLVTFPYASRVLLPEGIGHVNSFMSIINVIILCTSLGIPLYAVKEVARVRNDDKKRNTTTLEILLLHTILSLVGYVVVFGLSIFVEQINRDLPLFLLLSLSILFTTIGCEWYYQAVEDFRYITLRAITIRLLSIGFLFIFVKTKEDIMPYAIFSVFGVLGSNIFNFLRLFRLLERKYIDVKNLHPFRHLKGVSKIFVFNVVTSIYAQLNTVFLSFYQSDVAAGYYTAAMKLNLTLLTINFALANVMLPRLSNLIATGNQAKFKEMAQKSYDFSFALCLPLAVGIIFVSPSAMILLSGYDFAHSIGVSQIISFTIFFIALSNVMGIQILFPLGHMEKVIKCVTLGCIVDILACIVLIPRFSQNGAAWAYLLAEFSVTFSMFFVGKRILGLKFFGYSQFVYILATIIMSIVLIFAMRVHLGLVSKLIFMSISGAIVYAVVLFVCKDNITSRIIEIIKTKIK